MHEIVWYAKWLPLTYTIYRCGNKPWVPFIGPWGVTGYTLAMVKRQMGCLQFILMTHGLTKVDFRYVDEGTANKVKEVISDEKDVRVIKSGIPTSDTTLRYPFLQVNRGKGFITLAVQGPEPLIHRFDEPMEYKVEDEYRYESAFKQLQEKEAVLVTRSGKWTNEKATLMTCMDKAMEEILR